MPNNGDARVIALQAYFGGQVWNILYRITRNWLDIKFDKNDFGKVVEAFFLRFEALKAQWLQKKHVL